MKKILSIFLLLFTFAACEKSIEEPQIPDQNMVDFPVFEATVEQFGDTKTSIDDRLNILWNEQDQISLFNKNTYNAQYGIEAGAGTTGASLKLVGQPGTGDPNNGYVVAAYPYKSDIELVLDEAYKYCLLGLEMPSIQHYVKDSFDPSAFMMGAYSSDMHLKFSTFSSLLKFRLTGDTKITSIHVIANENFTGYTDLSLTLDDEYTSGANKNEVSLICDEPVQLTSTPTDFMIGIVPVEFVNGFTVTFRDDKGGKMVVKSAPNQKVGRNQILKMPVLEYKPVMASAPGMGEVWIKTTTGQKPEQKIATDALLNGQNELGYWVYTSPTYIYQTVNQQFKGCEDIKEAWVGEGIETLTYEAFQDCINLEKVTLPSTLKYMGNSVFKNCKKLKEITFPDNFIGFNIENLMYTQQFRGCTSLTTIHIPDNVELISHYCFADCTSLEEITVGPKSQLKSIGSSSFQNCTSLTKFILPPSVKTLDSNSFASCTNLTEFIIPENSQLELVCDSSWGGCSGLKELNFNSPVSFDYAAFDGVSLDKLTLSSKTKSLGGYSVRGSIKELWLLFDRTCQISESAFVFYDHAMGTNVFLNSDWLNADGLNKPIKDTQGAYFWLPAKNGSARWGSITLVDSKGNILDPQPWNM